MNEYILTKDDSSYGPNAWSIYTVQSDLALDDVGSYKWRARVSGVTCEEAKAMAEALFNVPVV